MKLNRNTKRYVLRDSVLIARLAMAGYTADMLRDMNNRELLSAIHAL